MGNFCHSNEVKMNTLTFQQVHVCTFFSSLCGEYTAVSSNAASITTGKTWVLSAGLHRRWQQNLILERNTCKDGATFSSCGTDGLRGDKHSLQVWLWSLFSLGQYSKILLGAQPMSGMFGTLTERFLISIHVYEMHHGGKSSAPFHRYSGERQRTARMSLLEVGNPQPPPHTAWHIGNTLQTCNHPPVATWQRLACRSSG